MVYDRHHVRRGARRAGWASSPRPTSRSFLAVQDSFRFAIARDTGTPLHYMELIRDPPSGEALKTLGVALRQEGQGSQRRIRKFLGGRACVLALRMAGWRAPDARLTTHWSDPAPRSEKTEAETIKIKREIRRHVGTSDEGAAV